MHFACFLLKQMISRCSVSNLTTNFTLTKPSRSVVHFEQVATFLEFAVKRHMKSGELLHYLDDFLGGDRSYSACEKLMDIFHTCMADLCVPLAEEKTEGPTEVLCF